LKKGKEMAARKNVETPVIAEVVVKEIASPSTRKAPVNNSVGVADSWKNPKTAEMRRRRFKVTVNGEEYPSFPKAFWAKYPSASVAAAQRLRALLRDAPNGTMVDARGDVWVSR
jgi:hypothetical protein